MNSGHQLLTVASIVLFTILVLNFHSSNGQKVMQMYSTKSTLVATSLAQSVIEEIITKAFDEKTIYKAVSSVDSLTKSANLGKDSGELKNTQFDDIDDYKNYSTTINSQSGDYNIQVDVYYIQKMQPGLKSSVQTFSKELTVKIANTFLPDTLTFKHIISY